MQTMMLWTVSEFATTASPPGSTTAPKRCIPPMASYFERWMWSAEQRLLRKGTIALALV